jgi:4,5-DOPA dioxygenase extradiol
MTTPTIFLGHGNPMNAISRNAYTESWANLGRSIPRPVAVLAVSAHWYGPGTAVTANPRPPTIHDFGGFPKELYQVQYPAPGNPELAQRVAEMLAPIPVRLDQGWGLDHGTWSVLCHVFPEAQVPVIQLSIDANQPPEFHHAAGKRLSALRDQGVLILGSGNIVHNLRAFAWGRAGAEPYAWAARFENTVRERIQAGDDAALITYLTLDPEASLSVPTPDHYLPLLYVLGARRPEDPVDFPVAGVDGGSISMLSVRFGSSGRSSPRAHPISTN